MFDDNFVIKLSSQGSGLSSILDLHKSRGGNTTALIDMQIWRVKMMKSTRLAGLLLSSLLMCSGAFAADNVINPTRGTIDSVNDSSFRLPPVRARNWMSN